MASNLLDDIQQQALDPEIPLADTLRKLVALGGQAGSTELREWASRELRGYAGSGIDLPDYRKPGAVMMLNAMKGNYQITGQQISPRYLPEAVREFIDEEVALGQPVGEIEAMYQQAQGEGGYLKLTLPRSQDLTAMMNAETGDPFQHRRPSIGP